jgi:hypothetical protein
MAATAAKSAADTCRHAASMASIRPIIPKFLAIPLLPDHTALSDLVTARGECRPLAVADLWRHAALFDRETARGAGTQLSTMTAEPHL